MLLDEKDGKIKLFLVLILSIISILLVIYFKILFKTNILIAYSFYIPTILATLWWKKRGLAFPLGFIPVIIVLQIITWQDNLIFEIINDYIICAFLILIGTVVAYLSEQIEKSEVDRENIIEDLRRSNEDLQQFAYVASHDLQEPLRAIISFSQLLEEEYNEKVDEAGKEYLYFITDGAKKMNTLIKDLLRYSRITTFAKPLEWNNLNDILKDVLFNLSESIKESGAIITHDDLPTLKVDKTQFIQLFQNFINNAIKFRRKITPEIHIGVKKINIGWLSSIKDNGIGIESQYFDRLYNIFYRLHTKEEYPGTGIRLPICKKIVQRYGGQVWVESELGKGSTFYFTISEQTADNIKKIIK